MQIQVLGLMGTSGRANIAATRTAGAREMMLRLPNGNETRLGADGAALSASQHQRVAWARVLYGLPFLVVLDEPKSNLDAEGEAVLNEAIGRLPSAGCAIWIASLLFLHTALVR